MKIINDIGAPNIILKAVERGIHPINPNRYGVTSLIGPPQIRQLKIRHDADIVLPLSSFNWLLMGTALHSVFQSGETDNVFVEEYLRCPIPGIHGIEISGVADLIEPLEDGKYRLVDHKTTSVWSRTTGNLPREDWIQQLNVYAYMYAKELNCTIGEAAVFVFYRDWKVTKSYIDSEYPPSMETIQIPLWDEDRQIAFIRERVLYHQGAESLSDEALPPCSLEDRWADDTKFAVTKQGNKRAHRVLDDEDEAKKMAEDLTQGSVKYIVQRREGERWRRCKMNGCSVAPFCRQFASSGAKKT